MTAPSANSHNTLNSDMERFTALVKASLLAISADIFLFILKLTLAAITGSAVLQADAWHSAADFAVSLTVLTSIIANHKLKTSPWARNAEGLVALFISFVLIIGGLSVVIGAFSGETAKYTLSAGIPLVIAIAGISLAIAIAFAMFRFKRRVGEKRQSIAFVAESAHTFSDFLTSIGVWLTLVLGFFGVHIERITTFVVGLIVIRIGALIFIRAMNFFGLSFKIKFKFEKLLPRRIRGPVVKLAEAVAGFCRKFKDAEGKFGEVYESWILRRKRSLTVCLIIFIALLYVATGFYSIAPYQTGVELRFGEAARLTSPGWHYHLPKPLGDIVKVDTGVKARVESGYRTVWDFEGQEPEAYLWEYAHRQGRYVRTPEEAITITGDENLVDANVLCYYRIDDPVQYALNCGNAHEILRSIFSFEVHRMLGMCRLDSLLTTGRGAVQANLRLAMIEAVSELSLGVEVLDIYLQELHPPLEVVPQYRAVASAREKKSQIIHQASAYSNNLIPRSRGEAKAAVLHSEAYAMERIAAAQGAAESFNLKQRNYRRFPGLQRDRMWWDTVETTMVGKKICLLPRKAKRRIFTSEIQKGVDE